tara:strand:- start:7291 stop:7785 length:495 start_codon:yes stop_codon:yes gene_type:complete
MSSNTDIANQRTALLYYIKAMGESDNYINTITKYTEDEFDLDKITIYPLLNIDIGDFILPSEGNTVIFNINLSCWNIRDINSEVNTDKFWGQDNLEDNLNGTFDSLNRITKKLIRDLDNNNITSVSDISGVKQIDKGVNLTDGYNCNFQVEMPNVTLDLCGEVC